MSAILRTAWNPECMLQPLVFYILLAAGLGLCLYLFVTLKAEICGLLRRSLEDRQQVQSLESALGGARLAVQALENDLRAVERQTGMLVAPAPARSGLNLSKRTQVLRMHRAGQDSTGIAAALALPRSEVDLLIKVHRIVVEQI
jgi:DNA-binding NarL/FixJ family response regulator